MERAFSFFYRRQRLLMLGAALYVLALILSHATLPPIHVWLIAAFFSVLMNLIYLPEAFARGNWIGAEALIAAFLISFSLLGVFVHPLFVILALFGHGGWDVAKHFGAGVPFFSWYTWSCCLIDFSYGTTLFLYWMQT